VQTSFIQISDVSCDNGGLALMEYDVDTVSNRIVMRIGADLYSMSGEEVEARITGNHGEEDHEIQKIPIVVYSDFHEHQERILPLKVPDHVTSLDVFETAFGTTAVLLGMRGQLFVNPVIEDLEAVNKYEGAGMNLPARRYRVAPGSTTGGVVRVLAAKFLPVLHEEGKTGRRLALILATDPISETAEHAFYLVEIQNDSAPSFVDVEDLPDPFIGGHIGGGSIALGGLGSINADSVTVSPCGRRLAWTDTDGRICVMTIPLYETGINKYDTLPAENERNEPMIGVEAELSWSPGGHYLAITHSARNQFSIISIADCGDPGGEDQEAVIPVQLGRVVQATPDRFNSASCYWGKTTLDIILQSGSPVIAAMLGDDGDSLTEGSTALFFLSDRDIVSDVGSPWGTRIPSPHFPQNYGVYALPLISDDQRNSSLSSSKGLYGAAGGAAELWTDAIIALDGQLEDLMAATKSADNAGSRRLQVAAAARSQQMHINKKNVDHQSNKKRRFEKATTQNRNLDAAYSAGDTSTSAHGSADQDESDAPVNLPTSSPSNAPTAAPIAAPTTTASNEPTAGPTTATASAPTDASASTTTSVPTSLPTSTSTITPPAAPTNAPTTAPTNAKRTPKPTIATLHPTSTPTVEPTTMDPTTSAPSAGPPKVKSPFPKDAPIDFGPVDDLAFARKAYRIAGIPAGKYSAIVSQSTDGSLVLTETGADSKPLVKIFSVDDFPSDKIEAMPVSLPGMQFMGASLSTTREYILFVYSGTFKVVANTAKGLGDLISDTKFVINIVDTSDMFVSIWPALEYQQLYNDAWRLLRDYFYDTGMNGVDWPAMHARYKKLVKRCTKREELDDILGQMAAELSALHVFVYGGEYGDPLFGDKHLTSAHAVASLGATLDRTPEYKGYMVSSIPERDPDFNMVDGTAMYSPLSDTALHLSGQRGLQVGDVIVGVNGESVMRVPDIHMLLRGQAGRSIRLDVLRLTSGADPSSNTDLVPEPVIVVPISGDDAANLRYAAWEYSTREMAKSMAQSKGFSTGYVHLRSMSGPEDIDAFFRGFFSDYDKQGLIIDVRHNRGGNIDSWLLDILQRRAWMYWQGRATNIYNGGLGWDEQFAFRGHLVVLIDEHTSSDGEGFARGVSELGLGKLIGRRTWGGGIWLSSDNRLVDGGIASAPEIGTYNNNFGWGLGIEQMGVEPDESVDNNPRTAYDGKDDQLEAALSYLADWIEREPIVYPQEPGEKKDRSMPREGLECKVGRSKKRFRL
jgi:C-terminal processing protease CtpA/Prc